MAATQPFIGRELRIPIGLGGGELRASPPDVHRYGVQPSTVVQINLRYGADEVQVILPASAFRTIANHFDPLP